MIRYDWIKLSKEPYNEVLKVIYNLAFKGNIKLLGYKHLRKIAGWKDTSAFLTNPVGLVLAARKKHTEAELYLYLELAAMRSYINYKETGDLRLPTYYIKHKYDVNKLKLNTALIVTDEEIIFKYEE